MGCINLTDEKKEKEPITLVVEELPTQKIPSMVGEDGNDYIFVTRDDALTEILIKTREIHKQFVSK